MLNRCSNFVLAAGLTVAIVAVAAGSAHAKENIGTRVEGLTVKPKTPVVTGIVYKPPGGKLIGFVPPKVVGRVPIGVVGRVPLNPIGVVGRVPLNPIGVVGRVPLNPIGVVVGRVPLNPIGFVPKNPPQGIWIPPQLPPAVAIPPVVVNPPSVVEVPPTDQVVTYPRRRYSWYTGGSMAAAQPMASTAQAPCNCLTKEYLQDGSVLFQDLCTKEAAILTVEQMRARMQGSNAQ